MEICDWWFYTIKNEWPQIRLHLSAIFIGARGELKEQEKFFTSYELKKLKDIWKQKCSSIQPTMKNDSTAIVIIFTNGCIVFCIFKVWKEHLLQECDASNPSSYDQQALP